MTLPCERYSAILRAESLLEKLALKPEQFSHEELRKEAYRALKHFPSEMYVEDLALASPDILEKN